MTSGPDYRTFASPGRGGLGIDPTKTALLFIEMQNEFTTEGGKLHGSVKEVMASNGMLGKASALAKTMRRLGVKIFHAPISFAPDGGDNPNRYLGILAACDYEKLFIRGTWNAEICDPMKPEPGDLIVVGKRGLSAFPNTNLEAQLRASNIETIALGGFMANCCVESTMRDACEKGFNVITLIDCVATTSIAGYKAATEITYPFFSTPMNAASFQANVEAALAISSAKPNPEMQTEPPSKRARTAGAYPKQSWGFRTIAEDVYQVGPWFVDVRLSSIGEKIVLRSGAHELRRYLTFAKASGMMGCGICQMRDAIYFNKMPPAGHPEDDPFGEPFGWLCNMVVVRLPQPTGGCLLYSPVLGPDGTMPTVVAELNKNNLLPVRIIVAPSPQHHLCLKAFQDEFPDAFFICGKASGQMPALTKKRRDLRFHGALYAYEGEVMLGAPVADKEGSVVTGDARIQPIWEVMKSVFQVCIMDDNRTGEIILLHLPSRTLLMSDLLYKSNAAIVGPGGTENHYSTPDWFAEGQEELFYGHPQDNSGGLLPAYRTHPRMRSIDIPGMRRSLEQILAWDFDRALACHTDPMEGNEAKTLLKTAWGWVWAGQEKAP